MFQETVGLEPDGVVGLQTMLKLNEASGDAIIFGAVKTETMPSVVEIEETENNKTGEI